MDAPVLKYDEDFYQYLRSLKNDRKKYMMYDLDLLGEGATGSTYTAYAKPKTRFPNQYVIKEQKPNKYCVNEFEALLYLRNLMLRGEIPAYYIFMYGCFSSGRYKYLILEKADGNLEDHLIDNNATPSEFLTIFWHIANAVDHLEALEFNHGDLWIENVMITWPDASDSGSDSCSEDLLDSSSRSSVKASDIPMIKIIDFDSAFKPKTQIKNPSYGGADSFRSAFYVGYDLNRFFDSLIYSYESYLKKKGAEKQKRINRLRRAKRRGKEVIIPDIDEENSIDDEFNECNIVYPPEIITFMYSLNCKDPNYFEHCPHMSGASVKKKIVEYAEENKILLHINGLYK